MMAISFLFQALLRLKMAPPQEAWVPRAHPYIFGINGTRRMGKHVDLNSKLTFDLFAPPSKQSKGDNVKDVATL